MQGGKAGTTQQAGTPAVMTAAEATVETLVRHGIRHMFALPGLQNDKLFDALHGAQDRIRTIHPRHEQTAAYMALGAALATGKPQAFAVVPGPGTLNATSAMLTAWGMNAPVLALLGQIPQPDIDRGFGHLHEIHDQLGVCRHFTRMAERIRAPHEAPLKVAEALRAATSGRNRPVALECAIDVWGRRGPVEFPPMPLPRLAPPVDEDAVAAAAKLIGAAERPLIVVGGGAKDASAEVAAIAEMLEAPVVSYRMGRGVVPTSHRLAVSYTVGHRLWRTVDVVLAVGTRLFPYQNVWGLDDGLKIVRIDADPEEITRFRRPAVGMCGDAAPTLAALVRALPKHNRKRTSRAAELDGHRAAAWEKLSKLQPQVAYLDAIRRALPDNGIFVDEVTQIGFASRLHFPVHKPRTFLSGGYQDNLGWGFGAALGAKAVLPDVPVVSVSGDGGFLYQAGELATAAQHNIALVVVVFDNNAYGNVRRIQEEEYGNRIIASDLKNPDFVRMAESFGVGAWRAKSPEELEKALTAALASDKPALVHVPCGPMPSPWDMIVMPKVRGT